MNDNSSLRVDKHMWVHYDGIRKFTEEYSERVLLSFQSLSATETASYPAKFENALLGMGTGS